MALHQGRRGSHQVSCKSAVVVALNQTEDEAMSQVTPATAPATDSSGKGGKDACAAADQREHVLLSASVCACVVS